MSAAKQIEPGATSKSPEMDIERNVGELKRAGANFRQIENGNDEILDNSIDILLSRVLDSPRREIENLIADLKALHNQLETNRSLIHRDIVEYADRSQQVTQLTAIISDSVENLPRTPRISQ